MSISRDLVSLSKPKLPSSEQIHPGDIHSVGAQDSDTLLARYKLYLQQRLGAFQCFWVAACRGKFGREVWHQEIMSGWKAVALSTPFGSTTDFVKEEATLYFEAVRKHGPDAIAKIAFENAGKTRVHSKFDLPVDERNSEDWLASRFEAQNVGDRLVAVFSVSEDAESYLMIDRAPGEAPFTENDVKLCYQALIEFPRVHYWLMLERGIVAPAERPFSPREKEVVKLLLGPLDEKSIAARMKLSKGTLHNYVVEIYKNLKVTSRYQLVQLWLAQYPA